MVGLSVVLESHQKSSSSSSTCGVTNYSVVNNNIPQVINKANMIVNKPSTSNPFFSPSYATNLHFSSYSSSSSSTSFLPFLELCYLCGQKLLPGKDIYMYKGDRGFCSVECRRRQIFMDEEDSLRKENCSLAAIKPTSNSATSSKNSNSASNSRRQRKSTRNREGAFVTY